ncbi:MAG: molybdenum cofactor guanylyltransferase [Syntrophales bacterium]
MTGIILSGGKNTRMGRNKALLTLDGERLIDRTVNLFKDLFAEVIIVTNAPREYLDQDVAIVTDVYKGKGALGGIYTGLFYATHDYVFVAACDMPFLRKDFIRHMMEQAPGNDIVVPFQPEGYQPLHAIYSKRCAAPMKRLMDENRLKVTGFYTGMKIHTLSEEEVRSFDPAGRMFLNINSPADLKKIAS